jgi:hypothetical protein
LSLGCVDELLSVGWALSVWDRLLVWSVVVVGVDWCRAGGVGDHLLQVMASLTRQQERTGGVPNGRRTWTWLSGQLNRAVARSCERLLCRSLGLRDDANSLPVAPIAPRRMSRRASPRARENCLSQIA